MGYDYSYSTDNPTYAEDLEVRPPRLQCRV